MHSQKKEEKVEEKEYIAEKILNKRITDEDNLESLVEWKCLLKSDNSWYSVETLYCPELNKAYDHEKKVYFEESNDTNIDCLPEEMFIKIFQYLRRRELGRAAQVSKKWQEYTRCKQLWKRVDASFRWENGSQNTVATLFYEVLQSCVTHLRLNFRPFAWEKPLEFEKFSMKLGEKCVSLTVLMLNHIEFLISFQSALNLCIQYMQNLEILSFLDCTFTSYSVITKSDAFSKIKVLDLLHNDCPPLNKLSLSKMSSLQKLSLVQTDAEDSWFADDPSILYNLEVLTVRWDLDISFNTFQLLKNYAFKLIELYLCEAPLNDNDFRIRNVVFPQLKTICLRECNGVTHEGIVSLVKSCRSLQNVYVKQSVAASYAVHPFVIANEQKLQIVKATNKCMNYEKNYLYEQ